MVDSWVVDGRPKRFGWAPGNYLNKCSCGLQFIGDKRAIMCAGCAYALPDEPTAPTNTPDSLREALIDVTASLAAAISLLERTPKAKKAAPSDKMFDQMILDYKASLDRARSALKRP